MWVTRLSAMAKKCRHRAGSGGPPAVGRRRVWVPRGRKAQPLAVLMRGSAPLERARDPAPGTDSRPPREPPPAPPPIAARGRRGVQRRDRGRRWARGSGGGPGSCPARGARRARELPPRQDRRDELQPGDRRPRQGSDRQGGRRPGRGDGCSWRTGRGSSSGCSTRARGRPCARLAVSPIAELYRDALLARRGRARKASRSVRRPSRGSSSRSGSSCSRGRSSRRPTGRAWPVGVRRAPRGRAASCGPAP